MYVVSTTHDFPLTLSVTQCLSNVDADSLTHGDFFEGLGNFESVGSTPCDVVHLRHSWAKSHRPQLWLHHALHAKELPKRNICNKLILVEQHVRTMPPRRYFFKNDATYVSRKRILIWQNSGNGTLNLWFQWVYTQYHQLMKQVLARTFLSTCQNTYALPCNLLENTEGNPKQNPLNILSGQDPHW